MSTDCFLKGVSVIKLPTTIFNKSFLIPTTFFLTFFVIGTIIVTDYGMGWDESNCVRSAAVSIFEVNRRFGYFFLSADKQEDIIKRSGYSDKLNNLSDFKDKDYGVINELLITIPGILLGLYHKPQNLIYLRHFLIFIFFWISIIAFFKILQLKFNNYKISLIGCLIIILSPRIFADSFYNSKDLMFSSLFTISLYSMIMFCKYNNYKWIFVHSLFTALAVDVRLSGNIVIINTLFLITVSLFNEKDRRIKTFDYAIKAISYLIFVSFFIIIFWPYLWNNPVDNFIIALKNMVNFSRYNVPEPYWGDLVFSTSLPWHYLPMWILITVPILYVVYFMIGIIHMLAERIGNIIDNKKEGRKNISLLVTISDKIDYIFVVSFFCPIIAVLLFNAPLYNGWRHFYFLYPSFAYISIIGLNYVWTSVNNKENQNMNTTYYAKQFFLAVNIVCFSWVAFEMTIYHPYQMTYFNELVRSKAENSFPLDYWGLSYRNGLEWICRNSPGNEKVRLFRGDHNPLVRNIRLLSFKEKGKFELVDLDDADYFITAYADVNFRNNEIFNRYRISKSQEVYAISSYGMKILSVYKLK
jgi:hypothetical protein